MKINKICPNIYFGAGKVQVYSDFDGTYCPAKHSSMHQEGNNKFMPDYCENMDKFLKSTEGDLHFHITTGRTYGEFCAVAWLLKLRNFRLPLPESFIAKNGSDEYIKIGSDNDFYEKGIFPYDYKKTNLNKEKEIRKDTNWDGKKIKQHIQKTADKYQLRIIEADSENSVNDYGDLSLFSAGKLDSNEWKKLPRDKNGNIKQHKTPVADYVLGSRKDGNLKFHLIFSPDYGYCGERNWIYDNFMGEIKQYLQNNDIKYSMSWDPPNKKNFYRNSCSITPEINNSALTKLYDTRKALERAINENDMVIVAGDGSNDFDMLNPLEYISQEEWNQYSHNSEFTEFYNGNMYRKLFDLEAVYNGDQSEYITKLREELTNNGFLKKIQEMPIYGIIINKDNTKLAILSDTFGKTGKIITVEKGELAKGIKIEIKNHAQQNKKFNKSMSKKFKTITEVKNEN